MKKKGITNELKVGVLIIIFAVAGFFVLYFMGDVKKEEGITYKIQFDQVGGIGRGDFVRYAGVTIGKVKDVEIRPAPMWTWSDKAQNFLPRLDENGKQMVGDQAFLTIMITDRSVFKEKDPIFTDRTMVTVSMSMMNDRWIEIKPMPGTPLKPDEIIIGHSPITIEDFVHKAQGAVERLEEAAENVNSIIGDPEAQENIKLSLEHFKDLTGNLKDATDTANKKIEVIADKIAAVADTANQLMRHIDRKVDVAGNNVISFTGTLDRMARTSEGDIRRVVQNLLATSESLKSSLKVIEDLVTRKEFSEDILITLRNIRNASQDVEGIASDIRAITSDGQIREDVKVAVQNARETSERANKLLKGVNNFLGVREKGKPANIHSFIEGDGGAGINSGNRSDNIDTGDDDEIVMKRLWEFYAEGEWDGKNGEFSPNFNMYILPEHKGSVKIGVDDLGYDNLFNLQYRMGDGAFRPRVGVVRSKLGIGTDLYLGNRAGVFVDAYDPRDVKVDVTGRILMPKDFYLHGGMRDVFDGKRPVFGVGKRF